MIHQVGIADFATFKEAAAWCRNFALENKVSVSIQRNGSHWQARFADAAFVPATSIAHRDIDIVDDADHLTDEPSEADGDRDCRDELAEEITSSLEDWARSDEEGWFYSDE